MLKVDQFHNNTSSNCISFNTVTKLVDVWMVNYEVMAPQKWDNS